MKRTEAFVVDHCHLETLGSHPDLSELIHLVQVSLELFFVLGHVEGIYLEVIVAMISNKIFTLKLYAREKGLFDGHLPGGWIRP